MLFHGVERVELVTCWYLLLPPGFCQGLAAFGQCRSSFRGGCLAMSVGVMVYHGIPFHFRPCPVKSNPLWPGAGSRFAAFQMARWQQHLRPRAVLCVDAAWYSSFFCWFYRDWEQPWRNAGWTAALQLVAVETLVRTTSWSERWHTWVATYLKWKLWTLHLKY